jgi:hypothetical protein
MWSLRARTADGYSLGKAGVKEAGVALAIRRKFAAIVRWNAFGGVVFKILGPPLPNTSFAATLFVGAISVIV